jgi:hypothetical protein
MGQQQSFFVFNLVLAPFMGRRQYKSEAMPTKPFSALLKTLKGVVMVKKFLKSPNHNILQKNPNENVESLPI